MEEMEGHSTIICNHEQLIQQRKEKFTNCASPGCAILEQEMDRPSSQSLFAPSMVITNRLEGTSSSTSDPLLPTNSNNDKPKSPTSTFGIEFSAALPNPLSQLGDQTEANSFTTKNVLEIVRHIASYLSLSEVESIASLYSSFATIGGESDDMGYSSLPIMRPSNHSSTVRTTDTTGDGDNTTTRIITPTQQRPHLKPKTSRHGTIRPSSCISVATNRGDEVTTSTIRSEGVKEQDSFSLGSGPDECAGLGSDISKPATTITQTARDTEVEKESFPCDGGGSCSKTGKRNSKIALSRLFSSTIYKKDTNLEECSASKYAATTMEVETSTRVDSIDSVQHPQKISTPPGLVALTPISHNDGNYCSDNDEEPEETDLNVQNDNDNKENSSENNQHYYKNSYSLPEQCDDNYNHNHSNDNALNNQAETTRLDQIQERLRRIVLTHPQSIRSYSQSCSLKEKERSLKENEQHKQYKHEQERFSRRKKEKQSLLSSVCTSCHLLLIGGEMETQEDRNILFGGGDNSPAVLSVTEEEDEDSVSGKETEEEINDYLDHLVARCSCSKEQRRYQLLQTQRRAPPPPPPHIRILRLFADPIFQNIPLSIIFDASSSSLYTILKTFESGLVLADTSIQSIIRILIYSIHATCSNLASTLHPKRLIEYFMHLNQHAMGTYNKASSGGVGKRGGAMSDAVSSVKSSVMGSYVGTSNMIHAFYHNSCGNGVSSSRDGDGLHSSTPVEGDSDGIPRSLSIGYGDTRDGGLTDRAISDKMFYKLNEVDPVSKAVSYIEMQDDTITLHAKERVKRMMHNPVSLQPFLATIRVTPRPTQIGSSRNVDFSVQSNHQINKVGQHQYTKTGYDYGNGEYDHSSCKDTTCSESSYESTVVLDDDADDTTTSPFMYTPKSIPATPSSRAHVLAQGTRFTEDVIFLARDQLRVKNGLESSNDKTRAMAKALLEGCRLAIFNAVDVNGGISLTCGQHCASKVGNDSYCSARGMIPMLRNCFVYFEMSVSTPPLLSMMLHHASLAVGLSTLEMPLNVLVGAWKGSAGLCSTGQLLSSSQWCQPLEPRTYGSSSVVGCLVYLDDESAFDTWDGVMVPANVVFNVNGQIVTPTGVLRSGSGGDGVEIENKDITNQGDDVYPPSSIPLIVPRGEELFPTLTLHSSQTEVLCRFSSEDIIAKSREEIGAPMGVSVYAVDGSVIFDEQQTMLSCQSDDANNLVSCSPSLGSIYDDGDPM